MSGIQHTETIRSPIGEWRIYEDKTPPEERDKIVFPNLITSTRKLTELVAYKLWEDAGRPHGRSDEFWFEAERQLDEAGYDLRYPTLMGKGIICCPYVPADMKEPVIDPDYDPKRGILTRYGKKLLRDQATKYERKSVGDFVLPEEKRDDCDGY